LPRFGPLSVSKLATAHPDLQRLFNEVIKHWDCTVLEGHRDQAAQDRAFEQGRSKLKWPNGNHNALPSRAVDVAPYPIDWNDQRRFLAFSGFVLGVASQLGIKVRWGGDWDSDRDLRDQKFNDLVHFELR
jgi:peptidoglycan L-alanyl-D-glutamate endopeptidase CwlK